MSNGRRRVSATFAAMVMAAASLAAAPAPAQTGGEGDYGYGPGQPCNPWGGNYGSLQCCYYPDLGWFYYYNLVGGSYCGYYQSPEEPTDRAEEEPTESAGQ